MKALTVIHPFGAYARGDRITDPAAIAAVLAGDNAHHVNRVELPDVPAPKTAAAPTA